MQTRFLCKVVTRRGRVVLLSRDKNSINMTHLSSDRDKVMTM